MGSASGFAGAGDRSGLSFPYGEGRWEQDASHYEEVPERGREGHYKKEKADEGRPPTETVMQSPSDTITSSPRKKVPY